VGVSGVWKPSKPFVGVSGVWKPVQSAWLGVAGVWKQVYTAALGVIVNGGSWTVDGAGNWFGTFTTSVTGGTAPLTYAWYDTGTTSPLRGSGSTLTMSGADYSYTPVTLDCHVTDVNGATGVGTGTFS
jgi:hypothetical protein